MSIIFFSTDMNMIDEWKERHGIEKYATCHDLESLTIELQEDKNTILIADYDSVAHEVNSLISSGSIPNNLIVLEKEPAIATGKILIFRGAKAYANSRMLTHHYTQMIETVKNGNIWTYPELTAQLAKINKNNSLSTDSLALLENRLSSKELEVVYLILDGLTNDAIASALDITTRTVKAHISSIFSKLHVNDRLSLVLLLK
ncbi:LuxR C-terminal-related transcriptional regulator [Sulfurimonas sp.]|uniref:response regulator transcription factor n=1 Tax=Sulfurimonas sp. TaxID=2022749 RepID=UPI0026196D48|nr:LuxR C-terminal-related transcriptional regulator [Sulfurimonas sp.]MCW8896124.1 LuxR C-terminal-related transcriptional regulator [Sulfurimonas sp.]